MAAADRDPADSALRTLLVAAVLLSVAHYADNAINLERYPGSDDVSEATIVAAWLLLTPFAGLGYWLYRRRRIAAAAASLAVYSLSGLASIGHYSYGFPGDLALGRHALIWIDIALGAAVLAFAVRAYGRRDAATPRAPASPGRRS